MTIPRWMHVGGTAARLTWKRDLISFCYIGKVFHVLRHRNSYNGAASVNYFGEQAFHPNLEDAKKFVQARREKGSGWTIDEYPALVIGGASYSLCLASTEDEEQFKCWTNIEIRHKELSKIASLLCKSATNREFVYRTRCNEVSPLMSQLSRYESQSNGGDCELFWIESGKVKIRLSNIFDLQKTIVQLF